MSARLLALAAFVLVLAACKGIAPRTPLEGETAEASRLYPDLFALYGGDQGIYRGCGPSGGVCHNSNEFPNLDSVGSILDNIGRDCNQKRDDPTTLNDLCEREGDRLASGGASAEIAWIELVDPGAHVFRVRLRDPLTLGAGLEVRRGDDPIYVLDDLGASAAPDPDGGGGGGASLLLTAPPTPMPTEDDDEPFDLGAVLLRSGIPGDPSAIQVGDPNQNGTFGAELDGKIIAPGDPARSYLVARLTDPSAGPLMPRANCCSWSKPALRALYCWVDGLSSDGGNAMGAIDYQGCSPGPSVDLLYPEPGPGCEAMGRCPVEAADPGDLEPTFHNVYARVLMPTCSAATCHGAGVPSGLEMTSEDRAFETLAARVVAGDPEGSTLYQRITPELCSSPCATMPLGQPPLPIEERDLIRSWIELGAAR